MMRFCSAFRGTEVGVPEIYRGVIGTCTGYLVFQKVHPLNENQ